MAIMMIASIRVKSRAFSESSLLHFLVSAYSQVNVTKKMLWDSALARVNAI